MSKAISRFLGLIGLSTILIACSMGGGETGTGYDTPTTTEGVITRFGSVYINGIRYTTESATVLNDDVETNESFLKIGMLVTLEGSINTTGSEGRANTIRFEKDVEGEVIENNYATSKTLNVLGQTVHIDNDTIFDSKSTTITSFDLITAGNVVEVSGFSSGDGQIYATRVEVKSDTRETAQEIEIQGQITNLNGTSFNIGTLSVSAANAEFEDMLVTDLANGLFVKVKSKLALSNGILLAEKVKLKSRKISLDQEDEELELAGAITSIEDTNTIYVNGRRIVINDQTELENVSLEDLAVGLKVKVKANVIGDEIIAEELEARKVSNTKTEGLITSIDPVALSITVNGLELLINANTRFKDDSDSDENENRYFNFDHLAVGDKVELSFYVETNTGLNIITRLEREEKESSGDSSGSEDESGSENDGSDGSSDSSDETNSDDSDDGSSQNNDETSEWESKGIISALDTINQTFMLDNILIDYGKYNSDENLIDGVEVEVQGIIENGIWYSIEIEVEDDS